MKTVVSVPDDLSAKAERIARQEGRSRSEVYSAALREYVARHTSFEVTQALDRTVGALGEAAEPDRFAEAASARILRRVAW